MAEFDSTYLQPWTGPAILLVDLDAFFASVEQLDHPAWRGKPVIVGGDADKHGVVSTASYEARAYGVHSAMAASAARELCPQAIWTHGHFDRYKEMSARVMAILHDESPHVQQVSIDEAFVDVSPTEVNSEHPAAIADRIQKRVAHLGVTCSIGVGTSKTVAKIASDLDKPRGLTVIYPGSELDFLFPLPIRVMSGVGKRAEEELLRRGIRTLGDMAEAPEDVLHSIYGKNGEMMRMRCLGVDATAVKQDETVKSVSNEMTFSQDLVTFDAIENAANMLAAKVARRLRKNGLKGSTLALKLRFADRTSKSCQTQLRAQDDNEHVFMPEIRRMLSQIWKPGMRVRLAASLCLISKKTRWFKNRSSMRLLSMRVLKMSKVLLRSRRLMRRLVGAFRKRPIKLKTALVKARSFSVVTCDLKTRQQELQRKTPPITLDSMHSALRCAALPQGTCFRCRPNQRLSVKHHYGSVLPHRHAFGRKKRPQWGRILH